MRIYVASRTSEITRVNRVQQRLRNAGHHISFDWTKNPASEIRADWSDDVPAARNRSQTEMNAIRYSSDALVLLWKDGMCGALLEAGMAMSANKKVIVSSATRESVFFYLPDVVRVSTDDEIIDALGR